MNRIAIYVHMYTWCDHNIKWFTGMASDRTVTSFSNDCDAVVDIDFQSHIDSGYGCREIHVRG